MMQYYNVYDLTALLLEYVHGCQFSLYIAVQRFYLRNFSLTHDTGTSHVTCLLFHSKTKPVFTNNNYGNAIIPEAVKIFKLCPTHQSTNCIKHVFSYFAQFDCVTM